MFAQLAEHVFCNNGFLHLQIGDMAVVFETQADEDHDDPDCDGYQTIHFKRHNAYLLHLVFSIGKTQQELENYLNGTTLCKGCAAYKETIFNDLCENCIGQRLCMLDFKERTDDNCPICITPLNDNQKYVIFPCTNHPLHTDCYLDLLKHSRRDVKCPTCRKNICTFNPERAAECF